MANYDPEEDDKTARLVVYSFMVLVTLGVVALMVALLLRLMPPPPPVFPRCLMGLGPQPTAEAMYAQCLTRQATMTPTPLPWWHFWGH